MIALLPRVLTLLALAFLIVTQMQLEVHFWMSFDSPDETGRQLVVMIAAGFALIEVFMLALAHDAACRGLRLLAWLWRTVFIAVLVVNLPSTFGAVAAVTGADHVLRQQSAIVYRQHEANVVRLERDIIRLEASIADVELNRPSAALSLLLDERRQRRAALDEAGVEPPQSLLTRIARLESAVATAQEIERLRRERDQSLRYMTEHAPPDTDHPQTRAIITVLAALGVSATGDQVRAGLALALVTVLKLVLNLGFLVATATPAGTGAAASATATTPAFTWLGRPLRLLHRLRRHNNEEESTPAATETPEPVPSLPTPPPQPKPKPRKVRRKPRPRFTDELDADLDDFG